MTVSQLVIDPEAEIREMDASPLRIGGPCKACRSPFRPLIDAALRADKSPNVIERHLTGKYRVLVSRMTIRTHRERGHHLEEQTRG